jgi:Domain of unknown function (DUF4268)
MAKPSRVVLVQPTSGEIQHLGKKTFSELGIKERQHLENWILTNPEVLGEPLLILSTEFDRFDKSDKRLDILALDSSGKLVIVELKRNITDTLAELQAIRYAAFCSTMRFEQIVSLRAEHIGKDETAAESDIRSFVEDPNFSRLDSKPRIILAAGGFDDPSLTSCVLWLRTFQVDIQCVELAPYELPDGHLILVPRTLIPLPEAAEFVFSVEEKVATEQALNSSQRFYLDRNKQILARFRDLLPDRAPAQASPRNYMQVPTRYRGIHFEWMHRSRPSKLLIVAVHFETSSKERNRKLCEMLKGQRSQIEEALQETVEFSLDLRGEWSAAYTEKADDPWSDALVQWAAGEMAALIRVIQPLLDESCGQSA